MSTNLSPQIQTQLEQLRDIRLPDPIGWWPLAPGWWAVAALCLAVLAGALLWSVLRRRTVRYAALRELDALRLEGTPADMSRIATQISALLRRVAIRINGRAVGLLNGRDWAEYLSSDRHGMDRQWSKLLSEAPYAPAQVAEQSETAALVDAAELWIRRNA